MSLENNTYTTSNYIEAPVADVAAYLADGMNLNEYTLFSRMKEQVEPTTWLGTASGYQSGLYYHSVRRRAGTLEIVEWHCGAELGAYHHLYPMLVIPSSYFGSAEVGSYYHWISFVDPRRTTPMITQGLPTVHRSEARSLKAQLERRRGRTSPATSQLSLSPHTIFVAETAPAIAAYLSSPENLREWSYLISREPGPLRDDYDNAIDVKITHHDLGAYSLIEHDTTYAGGTIRAPFLVFPTAYAFGDHSAKGSLLHRLTAWPTSPREFGKVSTDDYNTENINAKRIIEARAGDRTSYALGCSYRP